MFGESVGGFGLFCFSTDGVVLACLTVLAALCRRDPLSGCDVALTRWHLWLRELFVRSV